VIDIQLHAPPPSGELTLATRLNPLFHSRMASQKINTALCYLLLDPASGDVHIGNAGLIAPLYLCHDGACEYVDVSGLPLGIVHNTRYQEGLLRLAPGEALILISDGVVEAHNGTRELYGLETLQTLVNSQRGASAGELSERILTAARSWSQGDLHDDMTAVVIQRI
jgi:serine phosphatase RsbU (regulator of sigma subunit)